jgi:hexosaminidase
LLAAMQLLRVLVFPALVSALWPIPQHISTGSSAVKLAPDFAIDLPKSYPPDLHDAAARTAHFLHADKLARLVPGRGASDVSTLAHAGALHALDVALAHGAPVTHGIAAETLRALGSADEAYNLTVPASGRARLTARSALGLLRGLTTFSQLWYTYEEDVYSLIAPIEIEDKAAYVRDLANTGWWAGSDRLP